MIKPHLKALDKTLADMAAQLPVAVWAKGIRGLGIKGTSLAAIIGECGDIGAYRNPSCVWKRMGLAVIRGQRQRRIVGEEAIEQGYSSDRRSVAWNLGACLMRSQRAGDPYRDYYDVEKPRQLAKGLTLGHAHNRAVRHMTKRLLRDLWVAWPAEVGQ